MLAVLVALPLTGLVADALSAEPIAAAGTPAETALDQPPSEAPAARTPPPVAPPPAPSPKPPSRTEAGSAAPVDTTWRGRIPDRGSGRFRTAALRGPVVGTRGRLLRYHVRVERDLPFAADAVAREVQTTLSDRRSWTGTRTWRLQLVAGGQRADFSVLVATPDTTDSYCRPLLTRGRLSCQDGSRAVLNARRWAFGASTYGKNVAGYRDYLINHEVGHVLGFGHARCPKRGGPAPVMVQQTKGLQGCRPNPWPLPRR